MFKIKKDTILKSGEYLLIDSSSNYIATHLVPTPIQIFDFINKSQKEGDKKWLEENTYVQSVVGDDPVGKERKIATIKNLVSGVYLLINKETSQKLFIKIPTGSELLETLNKSGQNWNEDTTYITTMDEARELDLIQEVIDITKADDGNYVSKSKIELKQIDFSTLKNFRRWASNKLKGQNKNKKSYGKKH
jgi:hypothetical protein